MTPIEIVQAVQTLAVVFLLWRNARLRSDLDLQDLTLGAIEREVEALHRKVEEAATAKELNHEMR